MTKRSPSDHFDGVKFFNPGGSTVRGFLDILRWQREGGRAVWPKWVENTAKPNVATEVAPGEVHLTFINHITFLMQFNGLNVLTDPVFSKRVSPFSFAGPKRVRAPGIALSDLPRIDLILLSHNHYDHLDFPALKELQRRHNALIVAPLENRRALPKGSRVEELDWWETFDFESRAKITVTPAQHWSARGTRDRNLSLWGGFVIESGGVSVYFAGDTGYGPHFTQIRERLGTPDVCLLPIGAYEPRWFMRDQHMNPEDAVQAHIDLQAKFSLGTHYGCFQLTNEAIDQPPKDLQVALKAKGIGFDEFRPPETGETVVFKKPRT